MSTERTFARPYAEAAFELAQREHALPQWSDMLALASDIAANSLLQSLMKDPNFTVDQLVALFLEVGEKTFSPSMQAFIKLLGEFKRLEFLPEIAAMYEEEKARSEHVVKVELTSAFPLDQSEQNDFAKKLKERMHCNILLTCATDKNIIGGAIIRAGDMVIDGSIRGRLNKLADSVGVLN